MSEEEHTVGDGTSAEETVAETTTGEHINNDSGNTDAAKLKELAENQKIRAEKAERELKELKQKQAQNQGYDPEEARKQAEETVKAQLEQRDLDEMEHSDKIKSEIQRVAKIQNISVRKAEKDPYVQFLIQQETAADRVNEAGTTRTPRSTPASTDKTPKFNMATEEGRKAFREWKASRK